MNSTATQKLLPEPNTRTGLHSTQRRLPSVLRNTLPCLFAVLAISAGGCTVFTNAVSQIGLQRITCEEVKAAAVAKDGSLILTCMGKTDADRQHAKMCYMTFAPTFIAASIREANQSMKSQKPNERGYFLWDDGKPWVKLELRDDCQSNRVEVAWSPPTALADAKPVDLVPVMPDERNSRWSQDCSFRILYRAGERECWVLISDRLRKEKYAPGSGIVQAILWGPAAVGDKIGLPFALLAICISHPHWS